MPFPDKDTVYNIRHIDGLSEDVKKLCFMWKGSEDLVDSSLALEYTALRSTIYVMQDTTLLAYYKVENRNLPLFVNNFGPFRQSRSSIDYQERRYKIDLVEKNAEMLKVSVSNGDGPITKNNLARPVILTLSPKRKE
ncbi:hypothetical protein F0L74_15510 [Chitinophaga agrisoli]|uniref:Uncharacterized protein n=1 Tax=Chitinophaga agrisoli TaxID=2607653 RepID=A0A5B2VRR4_9BACT|nr:hypothetical protein [Chitinophaga agrisoli]KAA2241310.1 hypothetical protein F0L74_15510 [Chitinophaga agrisoli]